VKTQPYVIRQGDYLAKLAFNEDFDPDTAWNDSSNDDLREQRADPNMLFPGDVLQVPDGDGPPPQSLVTGSMNTFTAPDAPPVTVTVKFVRADGSSYGARAYTVTELPGLGELTTSDGVATFAIPVTLGRLTILFSDDGESCPLDVGGLNPLDTLSGVFQRLQNLGCIASSAQYDADSPSNNIDLLRGALRILKSLQSPSDDGPDSAGVADDGTLDSTTRQMLLDAHGC